MLEATGQVVHRPGELGFDSVASARRRRRVMRFVQDQQAARRQRTQPLADGIGVRRVRQQSVRHQEAAVGAPQIDAEAGLHGLAQPRVVGDEQVDPRQAQRLAQRLHLIGVEADAGAERRLDQSRVGGGDAVPAKGVEEAGKATGVVEASLAQRVPALVVQDPAVQFAVPEDFERLALGVVVGAGQADDRRAPGFLHRLDQPLTGPHPH